MKKFATISKCQKYRYWLERVWAEDGTGFVNFVMLNPSTADAEQDDPTIRKCIGFAQRWGYMGMHVVNLFALRSTDPRMLYESSDPVGPENDAFLEAGFVSAERTIVAWGKHGELNGRAEAVLKRFAGKYPIQALKLNGDGSPRHPLYVPYGAVPVPIGPATVA